MSKAILVIDIPDDVKVEECFVDYVVYRNFIDSDYEPIASEEMAYLKPMPQKIIYDGKDYDYANGYNACIDEILGE